MTLIALAVHLLCCGAAQADVVDPLASLSDCDSHPCQAERVVTSCGLCECCELGLYDPVWGTRRDGWPSQLQVTGTIVAVSPPAQCEVAPREASIQVQLHDTVPAIASRHLTVYVGAVGSQDTSDLCGQAVTFRAKKLRKSKQLNAVSGTFDSGSTPAYVTRYFQRCYRGSRHRECPDG